jgi:hypothetical protein
MAGGAVTFRGSSTITRTRAAVRPAQRTRNHADTHLEYWFAVVILELARVLDLVPSKQQFEQEYCGGDNL